MTKLALVSGANRGIGLAISTSLAQKGVQVFLGCRDLANGQAACNALKDQGLNVTPVQLDTTNQTSVSELVAYIENAFGWLDILVNNAGIALDDHQDLSPTERMAQTFDVNVTGLVRLTEAMVPLLAKSEDARIVNVSSVLASFGQRQNPDWIYKDIYMPTYAATKAAVNSLTLSYARQLAEFGIKVNAICPGLTATAATNYQGRPVEDAAVIAVDMALLDVGTATGTFCNDEGELPW